MFTVTFTLISYPQSVFFNSLILIFICFRYLFFLLLLLSLTLAVDRVFFSVFFLIVINFFLFNCYTCKIYPFCTSFFMENDTLCKKIIQAKLNLRGNVSLFKSVFVNIQPVPSSLMHFYPHAFVSLFIFFLSFTLILWLPKPIPN